MVAKRQKNTSLGNSMLNHPEHVTLILWIFLKFLLVVGIIKIEKKLENIGLYLQAVQILWHY